MKLNDFEYIQKESNPIGKVILIGMMEDGPTAQPFRLTKELSARFLLGDNEITRTYNLLIANGVSIEDIILFRLNGTPSYAILEHEEEKIFSLQSLVSNEEENKITFTVSEEGVSLFSNYAEEYISENKRKNFSRTYRFDEYPYLANLAEAITKDAILGFHSIIAESHQALPSEILKEQPGPKGFSYGDSEKSLIIKDGLFPEGEVDDEGTYTYDYWQRFYNHLLGQDFDGESASNLMDVAAEVIYFADAPVNKLNEVAVLAGRVAQQKTETQDILCTALFRTSVVPQVRQLEEGEYLNEDGNFYNIDTGEMEEWLPRKEQEEFVKELVSLFTLEEQFYEEMANVQIVVGDELAPSRYEGNVSELMSGAAHHLIHLIEGNLTPTTNKSLESFFEINAPLDKDLIDKLSAKGYICIVESIRKNAVTTKVQSMQKSERLVDEFYFKKMLSYISYDIRQFLDKYIGSTLTVYNTSKIEDTLQEYLQGYVDARLIQSFTFGERVSEELEYSSSISINIVAYGELESIKGSAQLNDSGWEVDLWTMNNF